MHANRGKYHEPNRPGKNIASKAPGRTRRQPTRIATGGTLASETGWNVKNLASDAR